MKLRYIALFSLLALAGFFAFNVDAQATPTVVPTLQPGWCYEFDFTSNDYLNTILVSDGVYNPGNGYEDVAGAIDISYSITDAYSTAETIEIDLYMTNVDSNTQLEFAAFGIEGIAYVDNGEFKVYPFTADSNSLPVVGGVVDGTLTITSNGNNFLHRFARISGSDVEIIVSRFKIIGSGENSPFGSSNCPIVLDSGGDDGGNPTSVPPPTATPTASNTPLPTHTYTPSPTSENNWCFLINSNFNNWNYVSYVGSPSARGLEAAQNHRDGITYDTIYGMSADFSVSLGATITRVTSKTVINYGWIENSNYVLWISHEPSGDADGYARSWTGSNGVFSTTRTESLIGEYSSGDFNIVSDVILANNAQAYDGTPADAYLEYIQIYGRGINPFPYSNCSQNGEVTPNPATNTPAFTSTPTLTPTPTDSGGGDSGGGDTDFGEIYLTPFATPTIDLTPTATPSYDEQCGFVNASFSDGTASWTTTGQEAPGSVMLTNGDTLEQYINLSPGDYQITLSTKAKFTGDDTTLSDVTFDFDAVNDSLVSVDSGTLGTASHGDYDSSTGEWKFITYDLTVAEPVTITFTATVTGTSIDDVYVQSVCLREVGDTDPDPDTVSENGIFQYTCGEQLTPPRLSILAIGEWIIFLAKALLQWFSCVLMPTINAILNAMIQFFLSVANFFNWIVSTFMAFMNLVFGALFSVIQIAWRNLMNLLWSIYFALVVNLASIAITAVLVMQILQTIAGIVWLFLVNAWNFGVWVIVDIIFASASWQTQSATDIGIPLHDCVNAPLQSNICAVFYIGDNTIFSGVGQYFIPLVSGIIGTLQFLYVADLFIRYLKEVRK